MILRKLRPSVINFNKEILFGEVGALICAPLISYFISFFSSDPNIISLTAVIGALIGSIIFWLASRIYNQKKQYGFFIEDLVKDIAYFTPFAFLCSILVYYPTLFLFSNRLLIHGENVFSSVIVAQIIAFAFFLLVMNLYRHFLEKINGKIL